MTTFLRLLADKDKATNLLTTSTAFRSGTPNTKVFQVEPESFPAVPGAPFAYWVSDAIREKFSQFPSLASVAFCGKGPDTGDDFQFLRLNWEVALSDKWINHAKGGAFSRHFSDIYLVINWKDSGRSIRFSGNMRNPTFMERPGLTWPRRTNGLSFRILPKGCVFGDKGPAVLLPEDDTSSLLALCALLNSQPFGYLLSLQLARTELAQSFEVGLVQQTPMPDINTSEQLTLSSLARRAWSLRRNLDTVEETSHAFALPASLRARLDAYDREMIEQELLQIQSEIDAIALDLYGFSEDDRTALLASLGAGSDSDVETDSDENDDESDEENSVSSVEDAAGLLSWSVGVAFGRFDYRLATGEREAPSEPEPFDPLPAKSPGMLPDGAEPYHHHAGILVDDEGHQHDLSRLIEQVLETVDAPVNQDIRRWLQKDFFSFHLQRYSKSRRKAPIYWPLSTASGSYTLWLYYPELTSQTLFTAVNDFLEGESGKLSLVKQDVAVLRNKGSSRTKQEEKELEKLEDLERELADLRDTLLEIAPNYRPNQDDGVQITAAPLWSLFRHKPWQKVLKDTWKQLEKGDYDWAHLSLNYWPDRVLHKCHEDRSLAIAHDVEEQFWEEVEVPVIRRGKDTGETKLEWQPKDLSEAQLQALINQVRQERSL